MFEPKSDVRLRRLILCKDSQLLNALGPSVSTFDVSTKSFNLEQPAKAPQPIYVILLKSIWLNDLHPLKA